MEFTTHLELHYQAIRLVERTPYVMEGHRVKDGILTLSDTFFQKIYTRAITGIASLAHNSTPRLENRFSGWALPASLAVTGGILVSFFSSP